jgi:hypothetical protein
VKKLATLFILSSLVVSTASAWGQNGHRIVGYIAQQYLTKKAQKNIENVLGHETLAEVSNFMDFIKSDATYDHMKPWHYCTIPDGQTYAEAGTPDEGDAIWAIDRFVKELKTKTFKEQNEAFVLKSLIHLVGDIHQPLHVGNGEDRGGNDVKLKFFWENSNLHSVWDTGMIEKQNYSYTEYANWINHPTDEEIEKWQSATVLEWANESMQCREQVYDLPESMSISYEYIYKNRELVNQRLLQAGIRLAGLLNEIYG